MIIFADSFDGYTTAEIPNYWSDQAISANASLSPLSRTGPNSMQPRPGGVARSIGARGNVIVGVAFRPFELNQQFIQFTKGGPLGTIQIILSVGANGRLAIHPASGPVAIADASQLVTPNIYNFVEWRTGFSHSSQNELRINGQVVYSGTLDGQATILPGADTIYLLGAGGGGVQFFDDLYVLSPDNGGLTTFLGDTSVVVATPNSDGFYGEWVPSPPGPHYLNVSAIPLDITSFNHALTDFQPDTYNVLPARPLTDVVIAVQLTHATADFDSDGMQLSPLLRIAGADFIDSPAAYPPGSYIPEHQFVYESDPLASAPWTPARVNSTEWGQLSL